MASLCSHYQGTAATEGTGEASREKDVSQPSEQAEQSRDPE